MEKSFSLSKSKLDSFKLNMITPLHYKLNNDNVKKFLECCNNSFINPETNIEEKLDTSYISQKIIENTQHISFEDFIKELTKNINSMINLLKEGRPLFINIDINEYIDKSNYWIYLYVIYYIKLKYSYIEIILLPNNIIDHEEIIDDDIVILMDDCIYSGTQMSNYILDINNKTNKKIFFYILCSYISIIAQSRLERAFEENTNLFNCKLIFNEFIIHPIIINDILDNEEINKLTNIYKYLGSAKDKYLIYFDHKLADKASTITAFYSGIVPNAKNHYFISKYNSLSFNINNLDIIPLIKNCENIKNIDMWKPECPSTPYKQDINKIFMKKYLNFLSQNKKKSYNSL